MADWSEWIGKEEQRDDAVTQGLIDRFHATLGSEATGPIAPPGLHWCLCLPDTPTGELAEDGHPPKGGFLPPIPLPRRMWAASSLRFDLPLRTGDAIERTGRIVSIEEKTGRSGPLAFVTVDYETSANGRLAVTERQTVVYREPPAEPAPLPPASGADLSDRESVRTIVPDEAMLFRFSALTFNSHRIHFDLPYARDVEGYPALIVHGPLTASLLLDVAAAHGPLAEAEVRAMAPAYCGQALHLCARKDGNGLALEAVAADGRTIMTAKATLA